MIKKISALIMALTIAVSTFASCSDKESKSSKDSSENSASDSSTDDSTVVVPEAKLTIDGKEIDTKDLIVCTIDGIDVDFDTFRYYYYYTIYLYTSNYGATLDTIAAQEDGFEMLMSDVVNQLKQEYVAQHLADENKLELDEDDNKYIEETIATAKANYDTDEAFKADLKSSYLTEDLYEKMVKLSRLYTKVEDTLLTNEGKYATTKDEFRKIVADTDEYSRVQSILIPYECKAEITDEDTKSGYDDLTLSEKLTAKQTAFNSLTDEEQKASKKEAKKLAKEVLEKAKNGDDFSKLITEFGWDPGMESLPEGYYVNKETSFVEEFKKAAFELKEDKISDLVENTSYGWFIIKRLPVDMDYVEENIDSMIVEYDTPAISQLFTDTMEGMEVSYGEYFDKITVDSIQ